MDCFEELEILRESIATSLKHIKQLLNNMKLEVAEDECTGKKMRYYEHIDNITNYINNLL